jgi:hypothetical protein
MLTMRGLMRAVVLTAAATDSGAAVEGPRVQQLAWLQGCWEAASAGRVVEEQWTAPRGRSIVGLSRTMRRGEMTEYELIVIRERGERLVYIAHPYGQPSAEFHSTAAGRESMVFENPAHDFPQRIGYRRQGAVLQAWIEGTRDGTPRRVEFPYRRVPCAGD